MSERYSAIIFFEFYGQSSHAHLLKAFLDLDFEVENTSLHAEEADGNTLHPSDPFYISYNDHKLRISSIVVGAQ